MDLLVWGFAACLCEQSDGDGGLLSVRRVPKP